MFLKMFKLSLICIFMLLSNEASASIQDFMIKSEDDLKRFGEHNDEDSGLYSNDDGACGSDIDEYGYDGDVVMPNGGGMKAEILQHLMRELMNHPQYAEIIGKSYTEMEGYSSCQPNNYMEDIGIEHYQE